jgi:hypothetical protein
VHADGRLVAIELELTGKRTRRLEGILRAYRRTSHFASVHYYCESAAVRTRIERIGRVLSLDGKLVVHEWAEP